MFLVGGFSDSPMLQFEVRNEFKHLVKVIIPIEVSLAILKGELNKPGAGGLSLAWFD